MTRERAVIPRPLPMHGYRRIYRGRAHVDAHRPDVLHFAVHHVSRRDRAHAFRRSRHDDVAGIKRVPARRPRDQFARFEDQMARVRPLLDLAVDFEREVDVVGIGHFVGRHEPRPEHRIRIDRLAEATVFGAAHAHIERDRIARNDIERARFSETSLHSTADDQAEFDFVVGAAIGKAHGDTFAGADERTGRFEKQAGLVDARNRMVERDARIRFGLRDVGFVVYRCGTRSSWD